MTFDDILAQILDLLQRDNRVSYRALKVRFQLDDDLLEAVKDELIYAKKLAVDEENRVLVWTGNGVGTIGTPSQPPQSIPAPPTHATPSVQPTSPVVLSRSPEAERRQLTVMFCDLVDSTKLSSQLDPEEYREVVRAYQQGCTDVIQRYDGHIAQLLGDGLLVYFGYPQAHEDDAQRAVRTGLGILAAIGDLNTRLRQAKGIHLAVRVGIHTGLVVVGEMGSTGRQEQLALGEVPNVCSRIQGLAESNTVAISTATYRLVQGYFACQGLGEHTLRGVAEPVTIYRVLGESGATSRLDIAQPRGLTPLVGRESEVTLLQERWAQAKSAQGQVVLLTGDAGIGKSRLVQMLKEQVANESHTRWECRSSEYYQNTALFPVTDLFQRLLQFHAEDTPDTKVAKLEHALSQYRLPLTETVPLFAPFLSLPLPEDRYAPLALSPQRQRQKTLESLVAILLELAEHQPVLFIMEDLHWTDPTTLEWLNLVIDKTPTASLLTLLTCRPTFQPSWTHRSYLTEVTVNRLSRNQIERMTEEVADGKLFPVQVLTQIIEKTDGVPLFVEEITKAVLESGHLKAVDDHYELTGSLSTLAIPATLQDSLMARLDRLVTAKALAQYAAVIGRQFSYALLHAVSQLDEAMLQHELGRLVEAEIVYQRGLPPQLTYMFKHALIQAAAYESLLKSTRQHYHQRIAQVLEAQFPETAEAEPELLAQHYTAAELPEQAVSYWHKAGEQSIQHSAYVEAISHLTAGLAVLKTHPDMPTHPQQELGLQILLGQALIATKGQAAPEVGYAYNRAQVLCQRVEDASQRFRALHGLWHFHAVRAELQMQRALSQELLRLAQDISEPSYLLCAHWTQGAACFLLGAFATASAHWQQSLAFYDPELHPTYTFLFGFDSGVLSLCWLPHALWHVGYPAEAGVASHEALELAHTLSHPFSIAVTLAYTIMFQQFCRDRHSVEAYTDELMVLCTEQGFAYYLAWGTIMHGWALSEQGRGEEGVSLMRRGLADLRATGGELRLPYYLALLAEACGKANCVAEGLPLLAEALTLVDKNDERWCEAELYRLKGALLLQQSVDNQSEAETCFQHALEIARNQQAKSLELRAARSLSKLWQQRGKRQEAHDLLAPVYHWFTEGFDTADLQDAKVLLDELA